MTKAYYPRADFAAHVFANGERLSKAELDYLAWIGLLKDMLDQFPALQAAVAALQASVVTLGGALLSELGDMLTTEDGDDLVTES